LMWCEEHCHKAINAARRNALKIAAEEIGAELVCAKKAKQYGLWLSRAQRRPYVLVTNWREAQPAHFEISQATPGNRPQQVVVICDLDKQFKRAQVWVQSLNPEFGTVHVCMKDDIPENLLDGLVKRFFGDNFDELADCDGTKPPRQGVVKRTAQPSEEDSDGASVRLQTRFLRGAESDQSDDTISAGQSRKSNKPVALGVQTIPIRLEGLLSFQSSSPQNSCDGEADGGRTSEGGADECCKRSWSLTPTKELAMEAHENSVDQDGGYLTPSPYLGLHAGCLNSSSLFAGPWPRFALASSPPDQEFFPPGASSVCQTLFNQACVTPPAFARDHVQCSSLFS